MAGASRNGARPSRRPRQALHLVFYSGGQERRNALIHEELIELALGPHRDRPRDRALRMTYVPFCSEGAMPFFRRFVRRYTAFGASEFDCLPFDDPALRTDRREAERRILTSDIVYLAGGNTYYFLKHMRRSGLMPTLRRFAARGGVLAGLSAGALLLTPHIGLAGYPPFDRDENEVGLRNESALGLVGFEFFPHYRRSKKLRDALARYSRRSGRPLYACPDGSGLVVEGDSFTAHGKVWLFDRGHVCRVGA